MEGAMTTIDYKKDPLTPEKIAATLLDITQRLSNISKQMESTQDELYGISRWVEATRQVMLKMDPKPIAVGDLLTSGLNDTDIIYYGCQLPSRPKR
jgi:exopolyphosphatase/pppGpp-phosphohydrolase